MKRVTRWLALVVSFALVFQPMLTWAGPSARVIPNGMVSLLEGGKATNQFKSEFPLPEGTMMLCNGSCVVQTPKLQLVAQNQATFAVAEGKDLWDVTVKMGRIDFAVRSGAKPIAFHTPHDTLQTEQAIMPADTAGMVKGHILVTETESVLSVQEGALQVSSKEGPQLIQPGTSIKLAQAQMTPTAPKKDDDKKKPAGAVITGAGGGAAAGGAGVGTNTMLVVGGLAAAGIGIGAGIAATSGGEEAPQPVSPQ